MLKNLSEEILENAREKANEILNNAKREARKILKDAEKKVEEKKKEKLTEMEKLREQIIRKEKLKAEMEGRNILLNAKREAVENAYKNLLESLIKAKDSKKRKIYSELIEIAKSSLKDIGKIYVNKKDRKFLKKGKVKIVISDIEGGVIAESKDGKEMIDLTFKNLVESLKPRTVAGVSKILFGDSK